MPAVQLPQTGWLNTSFSNNFARSCGLQQPSQSEPGVRSLPGCSRKPSKAQLYFYRRSDFGASYFGYKLANAGWRVRGCLRGSSRGFAGERDGAKRTRYNSEKQLVEWKLDLNKRTERLDTLKSEFRILLEFHAASFKDIDNKARYWLTVALPSFLALFSYLIKVQSSLGLPLLCAGYSLATCLAVATYYFSSILLSENVESGILAPPNRDFAGAKPMIEDDDKWASLEDEQVGELLRAIQINESANARKSGKLSRAEWSLFLAAPTATVLAAASAFAYTATSPFLSASVAGPATGVICTTTAAGVGIAVGAAVSAAFLGFRHRRLASKVKSTNSNP